MTSYDDDDNLEESPLSYNIDANILMHRDAHFGGDFAQMIDYYSKEGYGVSGEFDLNRIEEMAELEKTTGKNLAAMLLSGADIEKIARSRQTYQGLRNLYDIKNPKSPIPVLIADLIFAEEEDLSNTIEHVVAQKGTIVPALIDLLRNEDFYDPLFPGYGLAPQHAAQCLGQIGDKRAIISLFEAMREGDFFNEDVILDAMHAIGAPAKEFLLKVLHGRPITADNEQAAIALLEFKHDPDVAAACFKMLEAIDIIQQLPLATYLVLACEGLQTPEERQKLLDFAKNPKTPKSIQQDILTISKEWSLR